MHDDISIKALRYMVNSIVEAEMPSAVVASFHKRIRPGFTRIAAIVDVHGEFPTIGEHGMFAMGEEQCVANWESFYGHLPDALRIEDPGWQMYTGERQPPGHFGCPIDSHPMDERSEQQPGTP